MKKGSKKKIPLSKCIKRSWKFQDFKETGHPYWELWNKIIHETMPDSYRNKQEKPNE